MRDTQLITKIYDGPEERNDPFGGFLDETHIQKLALMKLLVYIL
jgi:hypothetical protein